MTSFPITLTDGLLSVCFDHTGVAMRVWLGGLTRIDWGEVEFISTTPQMTRGPEHWRQKENPLARPPLNAFLENMGFMELDIVIRDRRPIVTRTQGWWTRSVIAGRLRPMLDASDRRRPDQSLLRLRAGISALGGTPTPLLDLLAKHCRFDLVVDF
jgi:hypothetical protein